MAEEPATTTLPPVVSASIRALQLSLPSILPSLSVAASDDNTATSLIDKARGEGEAEGEDIPHHQVVTWEDVAGDAKVIADSLRNESLRTEVGSTGVIGSISELLKASFETAGTSTKLEEITQLLRIIGNLCFDHDANRQLCVDSSIPQTIISILSSRLQLVLLDPKIGVQAGRVYEDQPKERSLLDVQLLRAGVGALLNLSLGFEPVKSLLLSDPSTLPLLLSILDNRTLSPLRKTPPIYSVNSWASSPKSSATEETWKSSILFGCTIANWSMSLLNDLLDSEGSKTSFPPSGIASLISPILHSQKLPFVLPTSSPFLPSELSSLISTDLELLTQSASLLEGLAIEQEGVKMAIAFGGYNYSELPVSWDGVLSRLMEFVERGEVPMSWKLWDEEDEEEEEEEGSTIKSKEVKAEGRNKERSKLFSLVKAAVVRSIVEAPNSDEVMNLMFDTDGGKNWVVEQLIRWIDPAFGRDTDSDEDEADDEEVVDEKGKGKEGEEVVVVKGKEKEEETRDDLLICATHMLAALGRKDENCISLVSTYGLAQPLVKLLKTKVALQFPTSTTGGGTGGRPGEVTQVLFGVVGLLRHLSIPQANKAVLGNTGVVSAVVPLLGEKLDIVTPLQNAVVGLLKHLVVGNVHTSLEFIGESTFSSSSPTALDSTLSLISRTSDVRLRSESSRIISNVIRTFFSAPSTTDPNDELGEEELKKLGREKVVKKEVVRVLSEMVRLSEKYPMLINEGVVGLTLLSGTGKDGAFLVLQALLESHTPPLPPPTAVTEEEPSSAATIKPPRTNSLAITPAGDPPQSLSMLLTFLSFSSSGALTSPSPAPTPASNIKPEMVQNVCVLIATVLRNLEGVEGSEKEKVDEFRAGVVGPLGGVGLTAEGGLKTAAVLALEAVEGSGRKE